MNHLLVHTNQDIERRLNSNKDLTVHTTEYRRKRNPTIKPLRARPQSFYLSKLQVNTVTDIQVRRQNALSLARVMVCSVSSELNQFSIYLIFFSDRRASQRCSKTECSSDEG